MASYTGLSNLKNHVHRSGFDLSQKNIFSAKVGELLPVFWDIATPGTKYRIQPQYFTRTQPVQTSAYTRIREYWDFFSIPISLLWKSAPSVLTQIENDNQLQSASFTQPVEVGSYLPSCTLSALSAVLSRLNGKNQPYSWPSANDTTSDPRLMALYTNIRRCDNSYKLLRYLNYGQLINKSATAPATGERYYCTSSTFPEYSGAVAQIYHSDMYVNLFPLLAYQKIYQDFFRWSQWEKADPTLYNIDYFTGQSPDLFTVDNLPAYSNTVVENYWRDTTMFDLHYCNYPKDLFLGVLPNSQYGEVAVVGIGSGDSSSVPDFSNLIFNATNLSAGTKLLESGLRASFGSDANSSQQKFTSSTTYLYYPQVSGQFTLDSLYNIQQDNRVLKSAMEALGGSFTVLALRQAEALQKWKEITQSGDLDYKEQIYKHFGVKVPQAYSNMGTYIGGIARNLDISEVVNQNLADAESVTTIAGKGVGTGQGSFSYDVGSQYCVIMGIYHAVPLMDYNDDGIDPQLLSTDSASLPIPEFDSIGMETVPSVMLSNYLPPFSLDNNDNPVSYLGYSPRYYSYKTKIDKIHGAFSTTLKDWVAPWSFDKTTNAVSYLFFKVNPHILDSIFGVSVDSTWDTDQLLINSFIQCYAIKPMSRDGLPY